MGSVRTRDNVIMEPTAGMAGLPGAVGYTGATGLSGTCQSLYFYYRPHSKGMREGDVFTGVCPSTGGKYTQSHILSLISGPRWFSRTPQASTEEQGLATRQAVRLLRSRNRTFLFQIELHSNTFESNILAIFCFQDSFS